MRGRVRVLAGAAGGVWAFLVVGCSPVADPIVQASQGASTDSGIDAPEGRLIPVCGDGYRDGDEFCDDYENPTPGFGCDSTCSFELKAYCSDGVVTSPEVCDADPLYCGKNCTEIIGSCGDGNLQTPIEQCDAKGESATCDADCTVVECGDGVVNRAAQEVCDDLLNDGQLGSCTTDCKAYVAQATSAADHSCKDLLAAGPARTGFYWLLSKSGAPYIAYCDMTTDRGGWTLIMRALDWNFDYFDPLWSNETLEAAEFFDLVSRRGRSKYQAYVEVPFEEIRTSEVGDLKIGYSANVGPQTSAKDLFGANGGEGIGITIGKGPDALVSYFDDRADPDDRQWGCREFIHVGLNLHALLNVKNEDPNSLLANAPHDCDWDGGARFGQRVNMCRYSRSSSSPSYRACSGNHGGQGWGNFHTFYSSPMRAEPIRQLLWIR